MSEKPDKSPERFQFSLRTLLLVVTACAVSFSAFRMGEEMFALIAALLLSAIIVAALIEQKTPPVDRFLLFYIVVVLLFLVVCFVLSSMNILRLESR